MPKVNVYNIKGDKVEDIELAAKIFSVKMNDSLIHQAVVAQMANARQVLAHTLTKAEVRGGGKKPWKQKGTGRARAGSSRSPIWIGGGVTFGPRKDRNFKKEINVKMKRKAIFMALSDRLNSESLIVLENLQMDEFKTKKFNEIISIFEEKVFKTIVGEKKTTKIAKRSILVINDMNSEQTKYSAKNLPGINLMNLDNINLLDLLKYKNLILTLPAVKRIEERYKN
jgi:large subunit ribosomal protein L4